MKKITPCRRKQYKIICPTCKVVRLVRYCQKWNIEKGYNTGNCMKCVNKYKGNWEKGHTPWNKGLNISGMSGKKQSKLFLRKLRERNLLNNPAKITEVRKKMSEKALLRCQDKTKHPRWLGGKSFELYGIEFNKELKEKIRNRDNHICQFCFKKQLNAKISIHHIDYNKQNNSTFNLISLCRSCHMKTNSNRELWSKYFKFLILSRFLLSERKEVKSEICYNV